MRPFRRPAREPLARLSADAEASEAPVDPPDGDPYGSVFDRVAGRIRDFTRSCAEDERQAHRLLPRLLQRSVEGQLLVIENSLKYRTWPLCRLLLDRAWELRFDDSRRMLDLTRVALTITQRLDPAVYGDRLVADFRSRAWAHLGNVHRILGRYEDAERAFGEARLELEFGTGSDVDRALVLELESNLYVTVARFDEAAELLREVMAIYRRCGERHLLGKAMLSMAHLYDALGEPERQIPYLERGLDLVDPAIDPRLVLAGNHNLVDALRGCGRPREALALLMRTRPLYLELGDKLALLRMQWLEGLLAQQLGRLEQAEGALISVRRRFLEMGDVNASFVSLDLASLYLEQGKHEKVAGLADDMIAFFRSRKLDREALAAWVMVQQAADREDLEQVLLSSLTATLTRPARGGQAAERLPDRAG